MKISALDIPESVAALSQMKEELPEGVAIEDIMTGLKQWRNPINRFLVLRLEHTADPAKRSKEWEAKTRAGLSNSDWMREYKLRWESLEGKGVYQDEWSYEFHVAKQPLGWVPSSVVCRGWDFGLYPATVFAQLLPHSRLIILRECIGEEIDTERFIYEVDRLSNEWFPNATFYEFIDPTGTNRVGTDGRTYASLLSAKPLRAKKIIRGANAPAQRRTAVIDFLKDNVKGLPCFLVDPSCSYITKGFDGGYMYPYKKGILQPDPEKNIYSHIHDGIQYLCSKVRTANLKLDPSRVIKPLEPSYGSSRPNFQHDPHPAPQNPYGKRPESTISGVTHYSNAI